MYDSTSDEKIIEEDTEKTESDLSENSAYSVHNENAESAEVIEDNNEDSEEGDQNETIFEYSIGDSADYSTYFENLQILSFLQLAVIIGLGVVICFCMGFDKK